LPELNILIHMSLASTKYSTLNKLIFVEYIIMLCTVYLWNSVRVMDAHILCRELCTKCRQCCQSVFISFLVL